MQDFNVESRSVLHMTAQIRAKQLAIRDAQNREQNAIVKTWEENGVDTSDEAVSNRIINSLEFFYNTSKALSDYLKTQDINNVGYPITFNKTALQLKMALNYAKQQEDNLIDQIIKGKFYNGLSNDINSQELPVLQSNNMLSFWGNENSSVSSVLLASIARILDIEFVPLVGAATNYKFYNPEYTLPQELIPEDYYFASKEGMLLFGDYQYGGHRAFEEQLVFGPEDCSSSVGKATYLSNQQTRSITTTQMKENYSKYNYKLITLLKDIVEQKQLELIEPGDLYVYKNHCAIIATKPDNKAEVTTLQFSRNIDRVENKVSGGGICNYNLIDKAQEEPVNPIYILRKNLEPLPSQSSLKYFLSTIDEGYLNLYPDGPSENVVGDCRMFFETQE
ncbi:RP439 family protein [Rickettsia typhi]|uniref:Uncharacterized protein n=2 Tax=Rickettsia typhi TaxID=785 RepID=Q68WT9_RICTY|nr:hypothetical protein [Rickettsia typhi]AAU03903.1 rickettsial conserved hypothetical protein [Rickettsia typhi str. Wilmington]AFE54284.1 hypothetical protein RTTH1527_02095 [Rickettsia typhi str. TH1527]AFE55124.1 hypothetical protein RTB9991CWPP_02105 [Rickettsia typhi str. B9991CWPP]